MSPSSEFINKSAYILSSQALTISPIRRPKQSMEKYSQLKPLN